MRLFDGPLWIIHKIALRCSPVLSVPDVIFALITERYGSLVLVAHVLGVPSRLVHDSLTVRRCDHIRGRISLSADVTSSSSHMPRYPLRLKSTPTLLSQLQILIVYPCLDSPLLKAPDDCEVLKQRARSSGDLWPRWLLIFATES